MFLFCALTCTNTHHDRPEDMGKLSEQNLCEMMYLTGACEANVSWSSLGSLENQWSELLCSTYQQPQVGAFSVDTEHLSGWLSWRRWWLQGCLCECQSSVAAPTAVSQSQNYRAECSGQFTELQMGGSKGQMYSLLWFSRKQTARAWPAPHRGLFGQSEFMLGNRNKWVISNTGFPPFSWIYCRGHKRRQYKVWMKPDNKL